MFDIDRVERLQMELTEFADNLRSVIRSYEEFNAKSQGEIQQTREWLDGLEDRAKTAEELARMLYKDLDTE